MKEQERHKHCYDHPARCTKLENGNLVLVRQKAHKGKHKIQNQRENIPCKVVHQIKTGVPVYKVWSEGVPPKTCVLHRNMLFPLLSKLESDQSDVEVSVSPVEGQDIEDPVDKCAGPLKKSRTKKTTIG